MKLKRFDLPEALILCEDCGKAITVKIITPEQKAGQWRGLLYFEFVIDYGQSRLTVICPDCRAARIKKISEEDWKEDIESPFQKKVREARDLLHIVDGF